MRIEWQQPPGSHSLVIILHSGMQDNHDTYSVQAIRMYNAVPFLLTVPAIIVPIWTENRHTIWTVTLGEGDLFSVTQEKRSILYIIKDLRLICHKHFHWPRGIPANKAERLRPMAPPSRL